MADDLVTSSVESRQHRLVALDHVALQVEAEIHGRRIFVEVAVAILELLELAVDPPQLLVDLGQLERAQPELALGADLVGDVGEMAAEMRDLLVGAVAGSDVDLDRPGLARAPSGSGRSGPGPRPGQGLAERLLGSTPVVGMDDLEERLLSSVPRASSPGRSVRRAGLDPAKPDRLETIDHVGRRIIAGHVGSDWTTPGPSGGASKSPLRVSDALRRRGGGSAADGRRRMRKRPPRRCERARTRLGQGDDLARQLDELGRGMRPADARLAVLPQAADEPRQVRDRISPARAIGPGQIANVTAAAAEPRERDDDAVGLPQLGDGQATTTSQARLIRNAAVQRAGRPREFGGRSTPA